MVVEFPPGDATPMFRIPGVEKLLILSVAVIVLGSTTVKFLTLMFVLPLIPVSPVAPWKLVPVRVTLRLKLKAGLRVADVGLMEATVGVPPAAVTVNAPGAVAFPLGVATVTFLAVSPALAVIVKVAVTVVEFTTTKLLTLMPLPDTLTAIAPVRLLPVRVTLTALPRAPVLGATEASVGVPPPAAVTVNVTVLVSPAGVVTVTVLAVAAAPVVIVKLAVTVVAVGVPVMTAVTPVPDTVTAVAPVKLVPVRVTAKAAPPRK